MDRHRPVRRRPAPVPERGRRHLLPLRPARRAGRGGGRVDITFKLLYNAAVAMTGGQDATGLLPVPDVAGKLLHEGVKEVIITTDDPGKYRACPCPRVPR